VAIRLGFGSPVVRSFCRRHRIFSSGSLAMMERHYVSPGSVKNAVPHVWRACSLVRSFMGRRMPVALHVNPDFLQISR